MNNHLVFPRDFAACAYDIGMRLDAMAEHWFTRHPWEGPSKMERGQQILSTVINSIARRGEILPGVHRVIARLQEMGVPRNLGVAPESCLAFEDSHARVDSAVAASMKGRGGLYE